MLYHSDFAACAPMGFAPGPDPGELYRFEDLEIAPIKTGFSEYIKVSCPIRYGVYGEIKTSRYLYHFNLKGEITHIQGRDRRWPDPAEWLKRTPGHDWIYYSSGGYRSVYELYGEHYLPNLSYDSNSIWPDDPFELAPVKAAILSLGPLRGKLANPRAKIAAPELRRFLDRVIDANPEILRSRADRLHEIIGGAVNVVPPDLRHVDYNAIPLTVADGCLYRCGFCRVKTGGYLVPRQRDDILEQIAGLKQYYGEDLLNYNALFLGQLDGLGAGGEIIEWAAIEAYRALQFERSYMKAPRLFLFASVDSILRAPPSLFESLDRLPYQTYINVGLESADDATFAMLKKPLDSRVIYDAYSRMREINRRYAHIEVTANFVLGDDLSPAHDSSVIELVNGAFDTLDSKGCLYFSPLLQGRAMDREQKRTILARFRQIKNHLPIPAVLYLIQRL